MFIFKIGSKDFAELGDILVKYFYATPREITSQDKKEIINLFFDDHVNGNMDKIAVWGYSLDGNEIRFVVIPSNDIADTNLFAILMLSSKWTYSRFASARDFLFAEDKILELGSENVIRFKACPSLGITLSLIARRRNRNNFEALHPPQPYKPQESDSKSRS